MGMLLDNSVMALPDSPWRMEKPATWLSLGLAACGVTRVAFPSGIPRSTTAEPAFFPMWKKHLAHGTLPPRQRFSRGLSRNGAPTRRLTRAPVEFLPKHGEVVELRVGDEEDAVGRAADLEPVPGQKGMARLAVNGEVGVLGLGP